MTARHAPASLRRRLAAEVLGTALLVVVGPGAIVFDAARGGLGTAGIAIAFAAVVAGAVLVFGPVSGAHINPAVTVALAVDGAIARRDAAAYVVAQLLGAAAGSAAVVALLGRAADAGATTPAIAPTAALAAEAAMSGALMLVILVVRAGVGGTLAGAAAIGCTVGLCAFMGGPFTGASLNPARSFGPALLSGQWTAHWVYWAGPVGGMLLATLGYRAFTRGRSARTHEASSNARGARRDSRGGRR